MRCEPREFNAVLRQAKRSRQNPRTVGADRAFVLPAFLEDEATQNGSTQNNATTQAETTAHADAAARARGWIRHDGHLDSWWSEVTDALGYAAAWGFLHLHHTDDEDLRAVIAIRRESAFLVQLRGEAVTIDRTRTDAPWPALVGCLPKTEAAELESAVLSRPAWDEALAAARHFLADSGDGVAFSYELRHRDVPPEEADRLGTVIRTRDGHSRLGVALRDAEGVIRDGSPIEAWDTPSGRVAALPGVPDDERTTVTAANDVLLVKSVQGQLDTLFQRFGEVRDIAV